MAWRQCSTTWNLRTYIGHLCGEDCYTLIWIGLDWIRFYECMCCVGACWVLALFSGCDTMRQWVTITMTRQPTSKVFSPCPPFLFHLKTMQSQDTKVFQVGECKVQKSKTFKNFIVTFILITLKSQPLIFHQGSPRWFIYIYIYI